MADEMEYEVEDLGDSTTQVETLDASRMPKLDMSNYMAEIMVAKKYPRNEKRCIQEAIAEITDNKDIAEKCMYSLPRGGKNLKGPSVTLAQILISSLGNMQVFVMPAVVEENNVVVLAVAIDLEKNTKVCVSTKRLIVGKNGRFNNDMINTTAAACGSVAYRNAAFKIIKKSIVNKTWEHARKVSLGDLSTKDKLSARVTSLIKAIKESYNVTEEEILFSVKKQTIDHIESEDIENLIGFGNAIKAGSTTIDAVFRGIKPEAPKTEEKEADRLEKLMKACKTRKELEKLYVHCTTDASKMTYDNLFKTLK